MANFSCIFCMANFQAIQNAGGEISRAGSLWVEYWAPSEILVPFPNLESFNNKW